MGVTATPGGARLALSFDSGGAYSLARVSPLAADADLLRTAQCVSEFQEGALRGVLSYVETALEQS